LTKSVQNTIGAPLPVVSWRQSRQRSSREKGWPLDISRRPRVHAYLLAEVLLLGGAPRRASETRP